MAQLLEDLPISAIEAYFENHGLPLQVHSSAPAPSTPAEKRRTPRSVRSATGATTTHWAQLGESPHYGSGRSREDAIRSAAKRYRIEQAPEDLTH